MAPRPSERPTTEGPLTRRAVLATVWPIVLANASAPLLGLADTAVIGRTGSVEALGAIALGALVFSFVYWGFGFLRMATTGFVAQAAGADDAEEIRLSIVRPLLLGLALGVGLWVLQWPIERVSLLILDGTPAVEADAARYIGIRIWGAPGALAGFAMIGALIALGETRRLLVVQVAVNGLNIGLDVLFAGVLDLGVAGVALGTAIAEWVGVVLAGAMVVGVLRRRGLWGPVSRSAVLDAARLRGMFGAQLDIMIRTLLLLGGFGFFTNAGARFGDVTLAANHILLQLVSFSAFVLDGYAFATESLVGRARGAGDRAAFDRALGRTTELAVVSAVVLGLAILLGGGWAVSALTDLAPVRDAAIAHLPWAALYVSLSAAAFQLDGVFIGATRTRAMRDASFWALVGFLPLAWGLMAQHGNDGLWLAFVAYVVLRALTLGIKLPALRRDVERGGATAD